MCRLRNVWNWKNGKEASEENDTQLVTEESKALLTCYNFFYTYGKDFEQPLKPNYQVNYTQKNYSKNFYAQSRFTDADCTVYIFSSMLACTVNANESNRHNINGVFKTTSYAVWKHALFSE